MSKPKNFIKNYFKYIYDKKEFGIPMTPSYWVSHKVKYTPITRLKMSCGGGLGGSQWFEYVERISLDELVGCPNSLIRVKAIDGGEPKDKVINLRYMVDAEDFTVASMELNSQNPNFAKGKYTYRILLEDGHTINLVDSFMSTGDLT